MTTAYANITLFRVEPANVIAWLQAQPDRAYVSPMVEEVTVVYPENGEKDPHLLEAMAQQLSESVAGTNPVLAAWVIADETLHYRLYVGGVLVDQRQPDAGIPGSAERLAAHFGVLEETATLHAALSRQMTSAAEQHIELMDALIMPPLMCDMGFEYLYWEAEKPYGVDDRNSLVLVGNASDPFEDEDD